MGAIIARFRKKKSALDQLEKIDTDIKSIEKFRLNTELAQRKIVGQFILVSAGIYILVAVIFYFYFFPATYYDQLYYITPLLLVPFILWGVKRLLTWYYRRKLTRNENKLKDLRTEKKKLLDQVMDTETYKVAKTILEKFAPEQLKKSPGAYDITPFKPSVTVSGTNVSSSTALRLRNVPSARNMISTIPPRTPAGSPHRGLPGFQSSALGTPVRTESNTNGQHESLMSLVRTAPGMSTPLPLPREIIPRERSVLDKMVEYLVGDGPSNRFALICKHCQSHNGMALREEFEYVAFRCCYCFTFNPSRKLRPKAPKLELELLRTPIKRKDSGSAVSTSSSERNSDSDLELEEKSSGLLRKNFETLNELPQLEPVVLEPVVPGPVEPEPMEVETTSEQPGPIRSVVDDSGDKKDE